MKKYTVINTLCLVLLTAFIAFLILRVARILWDNNTPGSSLISDSKLIMGTADWEIRWEEEGWGEVILLVVGYEELPPSDQYRMERIIPNIDTSFLWYWEEGQDPYIVKITPLFDSDSEWTDEKP